MRKVENIARKIQTIARFDDPVSYAENLDGVSYTSGIDRGSEGMNERMNEWRNECSSVVCYPWAHSLPSLKW